MDLPLDAQVCCQNRHAGCVTDLILDPVARRVSHAVIEIAGKKRVERHVDIEHIQETDSERLYLKCSRRELDNMEAFITVHFYRCRGSRVPLEKP